MLLPTLAKEASGRNALGTRGVKYSRPSAMQYSTDVLYRNLCHVCAVCVRVECVCVSGHEPMWLGRSIPTPFPSPPRHNTLRGSIMPGPHMHALRSASKDAPNWVATDSRPSRPSPSLSTQLMVAAAGRLRRPPTPTAWSSDCKKERGGCLFGLMARVGVV